MNLSEAGAINAAKSKRLVPMPAGLMPEPCLDGQTALASHTSVLRTGKVKKTQRKVSGEGLAYKPRIRNVIACEGCVWGQKPSAASNVGLCKKQRGSSGASGAVGSPSILYHFYYLIKSQMQLTTPFLLRLNIPSRLPGSVYLLFYLVATPLPQAPRKVFFPRLAP